MDDEGEYPIILATFPCADLPFGGVKTNAEKLTHKSYVLYYPEERESRFIMLPIEDVSRYLKWRIDNAIGKSRIKPPVIHKMTIHQGLSCGTNIEESVEWHYSQMVWSKRRDEREEERKRREGKERREREQKITLSCWTISNNFSIKIQRVWRGYIIRKSIKLIVMDMKHKISLLTKS